MDKQIDAAPENDAPTRDAADETSLADAPDAATQAALSAPCDMYLRHSKGKFRLSIPALGLMVSNASLEAAYAEMAALRERRIREFASEGMLHLLSAPGALPGTPAAPTGTAAKLRPFFIKCLVVALLFLGAMNLLSHSLGDVGYVLEKKLQAVRNWTPDETEKQRALSEKVARNLGPVIRELMVMFQRPDEFRAAENKTAEAAAMAASARGEAPAAAPAADATAAQTVQPVAQDAQKDAQKGEKKDEKKDEKKNEKTTAQAAPKAAAHQPGKSGKTAK